MATYFVSGSGSDTTGNGSTGNPWRSLGKAYTMSAAGDTIKVRNGTYEEVLSLSKANQTWQADTGHTPVIDGRYHIGLMSGSGAITKSNTMPRIDAANYLPGDNAKTGMVSLKAAGVTLDGFVIQNVAGAGISITASNTTVRNCVTYFTYDSGIFSNPGTPISGVVVEYNIIRMASIKIFDPARTTGYAGGCSKQCVTGSFKMGKNVGGGTVVRNNDIAWGFGEGINIGDKSNTPLSDPIIVEGNVVHDINHTYLYINAARGIVFRNNTCYCTNIPLNMWDGDAPVGIRILDEVEVGYLRDLQIYNNLVVNLGYSIDWGARDTMSSNVYVGHNTLVGGPQADLKGQAAVLIDKARSGTNQVGLFENNIIDYSMTSQPVLKMSNTSGQAGVTMRNNAWSSQPVAVGRGAGDVNANPRLVNSDKALTYSGYPTRATTSYAALAYSDNFDADDYRPTSSSPFLGGASNGSASSGVTPPNSGLLTDYWGAARNATAADRDIGAMEYGGVVTADVVAGFSFTPTSGPTPLSVAFTDESVETGTATINSWEWESGDGQTSALQNPTFIYATAGQYTPRLTVRDTAAGLVDATTAGIVTATVVGAPLTADFSATPLSGTAPLTVLFTDLSGGSVADWAWDFGDGTTSTDANPEHTYSTAGDYDVSLTVTDGGAGTDTMTKVMYVSVSAASRRRYVLGPPVVRDTAGTASVYHDEAGEENDDAGYLDIGHGWA